jgi:hypothetical protein
MGVQEAPDWQACAGAPVTPESVGQQSWRDIPQPRQTGVPPSIGGAQAKPAWQMLPGQHPSMLPPHDVHVSLTQAVKGAVQLKPAVPTQQGSDGAPQRPLAQPPPMHIPPRSEHACCAPTHVPSLQQPWSHWLYGQHAAPAAPHGVHLPAVHVEPAAQLSHGPPPPPQALAPLPPWHPSLLQQPVGHVSALQLELPSGLVPASAGHVPFSHTPPDGQTLPEVRQHVVPPT